ncbi:MAG TPA: YbhB/YbcL family Raf kinase inhibitor-like protein [Candidatus Saccharimonadales bacterium]|nr:YbhB/YbcL family Raf kinase inhibitor-like protein [Candidatus Saccharimonadales bacterium]
MQIKSTSFDNNQAIPTSFTCKGDGVSPPLTFAAIPADAQSLALWMHDPDAPSGDFSHWVVWDIPATTASLQQGSLPIGAIEGTNDFGRLGYGGPCPPAGTGTHHYIFELFALATSLTLAPGAHTRDVRAALSAHVLAHATLTGTASA